MKKNLFVKIMVLAVICFFTADNAYSRICGNGAGGLYQNPGKNGVDGDNVIEKQVIEGAGYFLKAQSSMMRFLALYQLQDRGVDFQEWREQLELTTGYVKQAKEAYFNLLAMAKATPYNRLMVSRLEAFDFDSFRQQHKLNPDISDRIKECLSGGNVDGFFLHVAKRITHIEMLLQQISGDVTVEKVPELTVVWKINAMFTENHLFGQYAARVFYALRKAQ